MKTYRGDYYFESLKDATEWAVNNGWPTDRIKYFGLGWAIQSRVSGPYAGPDNQHSL